MNSGARLQTAPTALSRLSALFSLLAILRPAKPKQIVRVMDIAKRAGIDNIGFAIAR